MMREMRSVCVGRCYSKVILHYISYCLVSKGCSLALEFGKEHTIINAHSHIDFFVVFFFVAEFTVDAMGYENSAGI